MATAVSGWARVGLDAACRARNEGSARISVFKRGGTLEEVDLGSDYAPQNWLDGDGWQTEIISGSCLFPLPAWRSEARQRFGTRPVEAK